MEIFNVNDKEQEFQFNRSEMWLDLEEIDEEFEETLKPHTKIFTNRLRPMWLFYIKNIQKLGFFDYVLAKDGAMGLARFFSVFPEPSGIHTKILIDRVHYRLVPESWKNNVLLFQHKIAKNEKSSDFVLAVTGHECIVSLDELKVNIENIKAEYNPARLIVLPMSLSIRGLETQQSGDSYLAEIIASINNNFQNEMTFISLEKLSLMNLTGARCLNLNPRKIVFSESYVDHLFSSKGCIRIDGEVGLSSDTIQVGSNLHLQVTDSWPSDYQKIRSKIEELLKQDQSFLLENERASEIVPVFFNSELYSYVNWVYSI